MVDRDLYQLQQQAALGQQQGILGQQQENFFFGPELTAAMLRYQQPWWQYGGNPVNSEPDQRAHALLLRLLTPKQREEYKGDRIFSVEIGNRRYHLSWHDLQVQVVENGKLIENWCANLPNAPRVDTLIAQLLLLRSDPDRLRKMAVVTNLRGDPPAAPVTQFGEAAPRYRGINWSPAINLLRRAGYLPRDE